MLWSKYKELHPIVLSPAPMKACVFPHAPTSAQHPRPDILLESVIPGEQRLEPSVSVHTALAQLRRGSKAMVPTNKPR